MPEEGLGRILVIDNDARTAESLATLFRRSGHLARVGRAPSEGRIPWDGEGYDVVILDLDLENDISVEFAERIRRESPATRVIVTTNQATTESAIEAVHRHVFDYVVKPLEFEALSRIVDAALSDIEADQIREDMISMIAHDLKIPLTTILGYSSLLSDAATKASPAQFRQFAAAIHRNGQKILSLIENWLASCRAQAGALSPQIDEVDLRSVVEDALTVMRFEAEQHEVTLRPLPGDELPRVKADESLAFRALTNVMLNAIKYSPPGAAVEVRVDRDQILRPNRRIDCVAIHVANPGPGIPPEEIPLIFERFRRMRRPGGIEGSGVGLYVVKSIMDAHRGEIFVDSAPGVRTFFCLKFPVDGPEPFEMRP